MQKLVRNVVSAIVIGTAVSTPASAFTTGPDQSEEILRLAIQTEERGLNLPVFHNKLERYREFRLSGQQTFSTSSAPSAVPVPAAVWLFGSALAGLGYVRRRRNKPLNNASTAEA